MYTEPMALTGYKNICIIHKEVFKWFGIYSLGDPSTGNWCAARLLSCPPVINQGDPGILKRSGMLFQNF